MIRSDLALAALATAAVPGMRPVSVAGIRTAEESPRHQSALVEDVTGRLWVVRSPLGAAAGAELERNDDLVRQLGKHLPFKVPAAAGYADLGPDGRAAVYPYVEGLALSLRHLPPGPGLAHAVGRAVAAVHNMPRELFEEHAVPVFDAEEFRARKLTELDRAAETGHVPNGLLARWEQALDAAAMWQFTTVPTHGSLDGSSFLVAFSDDDASSGRVVGLTGWERAQVADPAEDFARLVEKSHPRSVDAVFESYSMARSQRPDGYLLNRARLASEMRLLAGLVAAMGVGDQAFVRARADALRKLDRLTANDDSLVPRTALAVPSAAPPEAQPAEPGPSSVPEQVAPSEATAGTADTGTTAPVPPPPGDEDDEPAVVVERPAEGGHLEPAHPEHGRHLRGSDEVLAGAGSGEDEPGDDEPGDGPENLGTSARVSPADVTAPIPMFRPVEQPEETAHGGDQAPTAPAAAEADTGDQEPGTAHGAEPDESAPSGQRGPLPDSPEGEPDELAPTAQPVVLPDTLEEEPDEPLPSPLDTEGTTGPESEADLSTPAGRAADSSGQQPADEDGEADLERAERARQEREAQEREAEEREAQEREAQERLHTLYGMPDEDEVDPSEPTGR